MFSKFLEKVIRTDCKMSPYPEYYSGRGVNPGDLNEGHLETIHGEILKEKGADAAEAFVSMVESIPVLSATDFLLSLESLERNKFVWDNKLIHKGGTYATDYATALATVMEVSSRTDEEDTRELDTAMLRFEFLRRHGRKPKDSDPMYKYGGDYFRCPYGN
jgi:hypothetical protein